MAFARHACLWTSAPHNTCLVCSGALEAWCSRSFLPFAVNHFTGSRDFLRALRYWCQRSAVARASAAKLRPGANGFRLNEYGLTPVCHGAAVRYGAESAGRASKHNEVRVRSCDPYAALILM